jgi:hypothetical protein
MYPISGLFDNIKYNRLVVTVDNNIVNLLSDVVDVISSKSSNRLDLIFDWRERILLRVLEHYADLILELVPLVWLA